jgi:hypothetical protein
VGKGLALIPPMLPSETSKLTLEEYMNIFVRSAKFPSGYLLNPLDVANVINTSIARPNVSIIR